jgi:tungstate transport system ATP-binding protein
MVTHDLGQVRRLADEVLFLHQGQLLEQAASEDFLVHAKSQEARAFVEGQLLW